MAPSAAPSRPNDRQADADDQSDGDDGDADGDGDGDDDGDDEQGSDGDGGGDGESRNARRRRRRRNKNRTGEGGGEAAAPGPERTEPRPERERNDRNDRDRNDRGDRNGRDRDRNERGDRDRGDQGGEHFSLEPVEVGGYLDLREEGYGFLRVNGYLPSRDDAYIPVKLTRQYGLRKGDHVTGLSRPAGRNEKNPALLEIHTINGGEPEAARDRRKFEDLTALFPDKKLVLVQRERSAQHDRAHPRPRLADRQGPAWSDRLAAQGGQDHRDEGDRHARSSVTTPR